MCRTLTIFKGSRHWYNATKDKVNDAKFSHLESNMLTAIVESLHGILAWQLYLYIV